MIPFPGNLQLAVTMGALSSCTVLRQARGHAEFFHQEEVYEFCKMTKKRGLFALKPVIDRVLI